MRNILCFLFIASLLSVNLAQTVSPTPSISFSRSPSASLSVSAAPSISASSSIAPSFILTQEKYRFCEGKELTKLDQTDTCTQFGCNGYGENSEDGFLINVPFGEVISANLTTPISIDGGSVDKITFYDGNSTSDPVITIIGNNERYGGYWFSISNPVGQVVNSTGNSMLIVHESNSYFHYSGFSAYFNCDGPIPPTPSISASPSWSPSPSASASVTPSSSSSISSSQSVSLSLSPSASVQSASASPTPSSSSPPSISTTPSVSASPTIISALDTGVVPGIFDFDIYSGVYGHYFNTPGTSPYNPDVEIEVGAIQRQRDGVDPTLDGVVSAMMEIGTTGDVNPRFRVNVCPQINPIVYPGPLSDLCLGWYSNELSSWVCESEITTDGTFYCGLSFMIGQFAAVEKRITSVIAPEVVNVPVNIPVFVPVPNPVLVPTHVDIPVPLPVPNPVDVPNPIPVPVPYPLPVPVDFPVPVIVPTPVDNPVIVDVPNPIPVPQYIPFPNPLPVPVPVPVEVPVYVPVEVPVSLSPVSVPSLSPVSVPTVPSLSPVSVPTVSPVTIADDDDDNNSPSNDDDNDSSNVSSLTASAALILVLTVLF